MNVIWDGQWVADNLGIALATDRERSARELPDLVGLALRRNPKRAHLLVSHVLGKHIPADPREVYGAGRQLGTLVSSLLDGAASIVLGYAETATGLGHAVADELDADYLHSTRRHVPGVSPVGGFEEEHSHATSHLLLPDDPAWLARPEPLVLVDDELSTGATAMNTIAALHAGYPRARYVVAALADLRTMADRMQLAELAEQLGASIEVVSTSSGRVELPADLKPRAAEAILAFGNLPVTLGEPSGDVRVVTCGWPRHVRESGRHGFTTRDRDDVKAAAAAVAVGLDKSIDGDRVLLLGCEELMYAPTLIGAALADRSAARTVRFSTTTRSPVLAIDQPGYPIRTALTFDSHDDPADGPSDRYAYNVAPGNGAQPFTDIVLVIDDVADTPALHGPTGLVEQLRRVCDCVHLLVLPSRGPTMTVVQP